MQSFSVHQKGYWFLQIQIQSPHWFPSLEFPKQFFNTFVTGKDSSCTGPIVCYPERPPKSFPITEFTKIRTPIRFRFQWFPKSTIRYTGSVVQSFVDTFKDRAHLSTFQLFIFEKFSCFIVLVVYLVIVQSSELISVWFCEKMIFKFFLVTTSLRYMWAWLPWGCRPLAG